MIRAADAEGGDSLRLSTWVASRAFSDLADHDVCPTCRARALDVAAPLHCTSCSARGPAALGPATSHIVLGGTSDRRSASNRTLWWHLSACNNANTSPCHTRHAPKSHLSPSRCKHTRTCARAPSIAGLRTFPRRRRRARVRHVRSRRRDRCERTRSSASADGVMGCPVGTVQLHLAHSTAMAQELAAQGSIARCLVQTHTLTYAHTQS